MLLANKQIEIKTC